ncbi:MarR family winged helix-turn-helix transcriptional regulator [Leifsonia sp. Root112D2]|jgi:DNA-binding MarR family transcriptional regulator|uniref:MarR family winged helix-turn-helix transcriptional regulator n=1 Tax=Leifsonia sp. Root112D2 TaxID=1736426 RepID=UPI0006F3A648|nr:MarR family winged helix-turn-helix transcriptional regulator [Leifsonia sp. Root112D2]KQV06233.1 MarR family transcriptional regulator [Leifsonia sp. Root112D2]
MPAHEVLDVTRAHGAAPSNVPPELHTILSDLVQTSHRLTRLAARVTGNTESPATWRTLSALRSDGPMRLGELAAHSRVSQPTMTKIVRNLVESEWVKRIADVDDARAWQIASTTKGEQALDAWRDQLASALLPLFEGITSTEVDTLRSAVEIVTARVQLTDAASSALRGKGN